MKQIKINNKIYDTMLNDYGELICVPNNLVKKLILMFNIDVDGVMKLVELEAITLMDLMDFYIAKGHPIKSLQELHFFEKYDFILID